MRPTKKKGSKMKAKPLPLEVTKQEFRAIQKTIQFKPKKRYSNRSEAKSITKRIH